MKNVNKKNTQSKEIKNIVFLVCGNSGVGKKSIVNEWKKKLKFQKEDDMHFYQNYFFTYDYLADNNLISLTLEIRVLDGEELDQDLKKSMMPFYKNAYAAFVVTDVNEYMSFQDAIKWKEKIDLLCCLPNRFPLPIYLLMNKCDLIEKEKRRPWMAENKIEDYTSENQYIKYYFTSTKEYTDINRLSNTSVTNSVDLENPLRDAIKFIMDFKDIRNDLIDSYQSKLIGVSKANKESKSKCVIY